VVKFLPKIKLVDAVSRTAGNCSGALLIWIPPTPWSSRIITLAGISRQNPHDKELTGQNPENNGLRRGFLAVQQTVTASTMIPEFDKWGQGQMSHRWCGKPRRVRRKRAGLSVGG